MNKLKYILPVLAFTLVFATSGMAQDQIAIPLSNPDQPGKLKISVVRGSISVSGYEGKEVIIRYGSDDEADEDREVTQNGLRKISNNTVGFEAREDNNEVEISGVSPMRDISFQISVPRNFSMEVSTVNGGDIEIDNINGEMELQNVNGEIFLTNVSGSAVANTVNGDIKATFNSITPNKPMAFSNLNGDIDITLPANAKVTAKMKSEWGDMYTDFDMDINRQDQGKVDSSTDSGTYKVSVNNWIYGAINGGGPEYLFKSMRGDIYIRKR